MPLTVTDITNFGSDLAVTNFGSDLAVTNFGSDLVVTNFGNTQLNIVAVH